MKYTATIIEDEIPARITLKSYLAKYFESIKVIAEIDNTQESIDFLNQNDCDILFLDIQLKDGKAIEILNKINSGKYKIVFTTAFDDYTLDAFKHKAFGYLLKPLDPNDFKEIVGRILTDLTYRDNSQKIKIPTALGYKWVEINQIIRCEAESNYTVLIVKDQTTSSTISKTLKYVEKEVINSAQFFRVHQSHLVNINYIKNAEIMQDKITLKNGDTVPVSRGNKQKLYELLNKGKIL